jgi:hypothetical protein
MNRSLVCLTSERLSDFLKRSGDDFVPSPTVESRIWSLDVRIQPCEPLSFGRSSTPAHSHHQPTVMRNIASMQSGQRGSKLIPRGGGDAGPVARRQRRRTKTESRI